MIFCQRMQARQTRDVRIEPMFENFYVNSNQRTRWLSCAIQNSILCRRSSRQCIARLIWLRSTCTRRPALEILFLGFRVREGFHASQFKTLAFRLNRRTTNCNREHQNRHLIKRAAANCGEVLRRCRSHGAAGGS
jgi:hypothetical protein